MKARFFLELCRYCQSSKTAWRVNKIYPVVAGLLKPDDVEAIASAEPLKQWFEIKNRLQYRGLLRLHSRIFGTAIAPPPPWVTAYCKKNGLSEEDF